MKYIDKILLLFALWFFPFATMAQTTTPHWSCNTRTFEYGMGVYFNLQKAGTSITSSDYEVAAFCGEECRGISDVLNLGDATIGYIRVRSNVAKGDSIFFKVYDKTSKEESNIFETIVFKSDSLVGMPSSSQVLRIREKSVLKITIRDASKIYGDQNPKFEFTTEGAALEGELGFICFADSLSPIGTYSISADLTNVVNENVTVTNGNLTVSQRVATFEWNDTILTYNGKAQKPVAVVDNLVGTDKCDVTVTGEQTNVGKYTATATALSNTNYKLPMNVSQAFEIVKADAQIEKAPTAKTGLVYNREAQELVEAGLAVGGEMQYSLDNISFSATIPTAIVANTYKVFFMVVGDSNHNNIDPQSLLVAIDGPKTVFAKSEDKVPLEIRAVVIDEDKKEVQIDGISSNQNGGSVTLPATIEGYTVTSIASNTFADKTFVTDIYMPDTEKPIKIDKDALKIDDEHIAWIHTPLALLDDYALMLELKQNFEALKVVATVTPVNKYWTLSCGVDLIMPDGLSIYICELKNGVEVQITEIKEDQFVIDGKHILKANNGVLVFCKNERGGDQYDLIANPGRQVSGMTPAIYDAKSYGSNNQLEPVIESKNYSPEGYYVLKNNEFYAIADDDSKVPACKAVLRVPSNVSAARLLTICVGDGDTTGLDYLIQKDSVNDKWYNLNGQRIESPVESGLYIKNGKKVIIK